MTALLLAEPEASMRGFLARQLSSDGFDVLAFSSPDELPRAAEPDVLVLGDPGALDRCLVTGCPVIVLGSPDAETRLRALEQCDDYLSRPFVYEELVGKISHKAHQRFRTIAGLLFETAAREGPNLAYRDVKFPKLRWQSPSFGKEPAVGLRLQREYVRAWKGGGPRLPYRVREFAADLGCERKLGRPGGPALHHRQHV